MSRSSSHSRLTGARDSTHPTTFPSTLASKLALQQPQETLSTTQAVPRSQDTSCSRSATPYSPELLDENTSDEEDVHFTLLQSIDPSKYTHLFRLRPRLTATNYTIWTSVVTRALQAVALNVYLDPDFKLDSRTDDRNRRIRWNKANAFVCSVLTASMSEEILSQLGHLPTAAKIWAEARRLYSGTTATYWTMTMTALMTTRHTDGEDIATHIAKMKGYRRDLILMQRNIDDEIFACFLRVSMPSNWNHAFAALPDHYTSAEVERCIRDEYRACNSQTTASTSAFRATHSNKSRSGLSRTPIPGQPYCDNCNISGHRTNDCYSPGGPMYAKPRRVRRGRKDEMPSLLLTLGTD